MACSAPCRAMGTPSVSRCSNGMAPPCRPPCGRRRKRAWQQVGFFTAPLQTLEAERRALVHHQGGPGDQPGAPALHVAGHRREERVALCDGIFCLAGFSVPQAGGRTALACPRHRIRVGSRAANWVSPKRAIGIYGRWRWRLPGHGDASSLPVRWPSGMSAGVGRAVPGGASSGWWLLPARC